MKKIGILIVILAIAGGFYTYLNQPHADATNSEIVFHGSSEDLSTQAETLKSGDFISVSGVVSAAANKELVLDQTVFCQLVNSSNVVKGNKVTVIGKFLGYDELAEEIKLNNCILQNP